MQRGSKGDRNIASPALGVLQARIDRDLPTTVGRNGVTRMTSSHKNGYWRFPETGWGTISSLVVLRFVIFPTMTDSR